MRPILMLFLVAGAALAEAPAAREVKIRMRDGVGLAADVYLPEKPGKYPTVLIQTPYNKRWFRSRMGRPGGGAGAVGRGAASDLAVIVDRTRYAYVVVDWRGFYGSRHAMAGVKRRKWSRGQDGHDCVEWIATRPWSNGRVGTWGGSALGKQQLDTAAERPKHLVCCVPLIAAMGLRYEAYYEGGVLLDAHVTRLDQLGFNLGRQVRRLPDPNALLWQFVRRNSYRPEAIAVPCLFITGWWDHYPDLILETFEDVVARGGPAARDGSRLLIGPWDHVSIGVAKQGGMTFEAAQLASGRAARAFLDYWLLGDKVNGWARTPRVRFFQTGAGNWEAVDAWSAAKRTRKVLHLAADRSIGPPSGAGILRYTYDPRRPPPTLGGANLPPLPHGPTDHAALEKRGDVLTYKTPALGKPLVVQGRAALSFHYETNRSSCDFVARLCVAVPDAGTYLLAEKALRVPGKGSATITFQAHAFTVPKGHRLVLFLSSGAAPRYERNPHTGADRWDEKTAVDLAVTVHHGGARPMTLTLPRLDR